MEDRFFSPSVSHPASQFFEHEERPPKYQILSREDESGGGRIIVAGALQGANISTAILNSDAFLRARLPVWGPSDIIGNLCPAVLTYARCCDDLGLLVNGIMGGNTNLAGSIQNRREAIPDVCKMKYAEGAKGIAGLFLGLALCSEVLLPRPSLSGDGAMDFTSSHLLSVLRGMYIAQEFSENTKVSGSKSIQRPLQVCMSRARAGMSRARTARTSQTSSPCATW